MRWLVNIIKNLENKILLILLKRIENRLHEKLKEAQFDYDYVCLSGVQKIKVLKIKEDVPEQISTINNTVKIIEDGMLPIE